MVCKHCMDDDKRRRLEEKRQFMQRRNAAKDLRAEMEPAISALEAAGERYRVLGLGDVPRWSPDWIPEGCGRIPWDRLADAQFRKVDGREESAAAIIALLSQRLDPADELLFIPSGKRWTLAMPRGVFSRHAMALLECAWDAVYFAAPPASWVIQLDWSELWWKDA